MLLEQLTSTQAMSRLMEVGQLTTLRGVVSPQLYEWVLASFDIGWFSIS